MSKILAALLVLVFVSSCSSKESISNQNKNEKNFTNIERVSGTNGKLIGITSNNVMAAGYDLQNLTMKVQFKNGFIYEYYDVELELWESFLNAQPDPWSSVGYPRLVGEGYAYRKIN